MEVDFNNIIPELHYYIHRKETPNWKIEGGITPFVDLTYVIGGKSVYNIGDQEYTVRKGDLICIPKNTYRAAFTDPQNYIECYSTNLFLRDMYGQDTSLPLPVISHIGTIPELVTHFHELHSEWLQRDFGYMMKVRSILCFILYEVLNIELNENHDNQSDPRIKNSIIYLSQHYCETITIETMSDMFHLHPVYYGNLFCKAMGMTFKQYLTKLRLNNAENMLKSGEYTVGEVALICGYSDIFYFSRLFKKNRGISPSKLFYYGIK